MRRLALTLALKSGAVAMGYIWGSSVLYLEMGTKARSAKNAPGTGSAPGLAVRGKAHDEER